MIPNWLYKVEHLDSDELEELEKTLNSLGEDGWELVSWDSEVGIFKKKQLYLVDSSINLSETRPQPQKN